MNSARRVIVVVALWVFIQLAPHSVVFHDNWIYGLAPAILKLSLLGSFALCVFESLFLVALVQLFSSRVIPKAIRRITFTLLFVAVAIISSAALLSWILFSKTGVFLNQNHLNAFFANTLGVISHTQSTDLTLGLLALLAGAIAACAIFVIPRNISWKALALGIFTTGALSWLCNIAIPKSKLNDESFRYHLHFVSASLTPTQALLWEPVFRSFDSLHVQKVAMDLTPRYDLATYATTNRVGVKQRTVLLIIIEALRADILAHTVQGQEVTPHLNRLSRSGISFTRAYAQSSESSYSKAAILTGLYPLKFPFRDTFTQRDYPRVLIHDVLHSLGYKTGAFYSTSEQWQNAHLITHSPVISPYFEAENESLVALTSYLPSPKRREGKPTYAELDYAITRRFIEWVGDDGASEIGRFASFYFAGTHFPYYFPSESNIAPFTPYHFEDSERSAISFVDYPPEFAERMRNRYYNALREVDSRVGELLKHLEEQGLLDTTLVIVTGDHGQLFHEHGRVTHAADLFEEVIRVPLIFWGLELNSISVESNQIVNHIDIAPTILSLINASQHTNFQGRSLINAGQSPTGVAFSSIQSLADQDAIILGNWKLLRNNRNLQEQLLQVYPHQRTDLRNNAIQTCLAERLKVFRQRQLQYYSADSDLREKFFPPQHHDLAEPCQ